MVIHFKHFSVLSNSNIRKRNNFFYYALKIFRKIFKKLKADPSIKTKNKKLEKQRVIITPLQE